MSDYTRQRVLRCQFAVRADPTSGITPSANSKQHPPFTESAGRLSDLASADFANIHNRIQRVKLHCGGWNTLLAT